MIPPPFPTPLPPFIPPPPSAGGSPPPAAAGAAPPAPSAAPPAETLARGPEDPTLKDRLVAMLKTVYDPEIPVDIYQMGMIYEVRADTAGEVYIRMTLTSPSCPVAGTLPPEVEAKARKVEGANVVRLDLVWDPPWEMSMISEAARLQLNL